MVRLIVIVLILFFFTYQETECANSTSLYSYNPYVSLETWNELEPYFLPVSHPIKKKLDRIFLKKRITLSEQSFVKAGFSITRLNRPINAIVTGHRNLNGYLIKAYLDSQAAIPDDRMWLRRIKGCEVIQASIDKHGFTEFILPGKWIYPLPAEPSPPFNLSYNRKNFILVVEDMHIFNHKENERAYKEKMNEQLLKALYTVLSECQLTDCAWIGNMPFTKKGKIAFIDTELFFNGPPNFQRLKKHLSIPMKEYLDLLIQDKP